MAVPFWNLLFGSPSAYRPMVISTLNARYWVVTTRIYECVAATPGANAVVTIRYKKAKNHNLSLGIFDRERRSVTGARSSARSENSSRLWFAFCSTYQNTGIPSSKFVTPNTGEYPARF